jgi:rSAM/selenodomain-associated transferase 2
MLSQRLWRIADGPLDDLGQAKAKRKAAGLESIAVIIPVLNEESVLGETLRSAQAGSRLETIVVDGGSSDGSLEVAQAEGARTLSTARGRARQMNAGAALAASPILLFLHVDTRLPPGFDQCVRDTLDQSGVVAGAFELGIASRRWPYRIIEKAANLRARYLRMPFGDQGLFLRADLFHRLGGFANMPIMEDVELVKRLRRCGRVAVVPIPATTSVRRWQRLGFWRTTWVNQKILLAYCLGVPPQRLVRWYAEPDG